MKVKLQDGYRDIYTLADLERAEEVIAIVKEYDDSVEENAQSMVKEALKNNTDDWLTEIIKAEASTAKNGRVWNAYSDTSGDMDIWIDAIGKTWNGFIEVSGYLTDIWQTGAEDYIHHLFIHHYLEV